MLDQEQCWEAVRDRDTAAEGGFLYAVRTTGIYCRPGCASRPPRRDNVLFFPDAAGAEQAGFRPCKRCRPNEGSADARHRAAIERACALIRASEELPSLAELADAAGISRFHFHRLFRQLIGTTPREWARAYRLGQFAARLDAGEKVAPALYAAGFGSSSRAYAEADGMGMTPGARRRGGKGETIRFATVETPFGWALVAATGRGLCGTYLADTQDALEAELRQRFPAAELVPADEQLRDWAERILGFIASPGEMPDLPLDLRGTAFQARVWRALRAIPIGSTASYSEIAAAIGRPDSVRAVASACANNPVALLVPCHRAVRRDGALAGYRWGIERKRDLLAREQAAAAGE